MPCFKIMDQGHWIHVPNMYNREWVRYLSSADKWFTWVCGCTGDSAGVEIVLKLGLQNRRPNYTNSTCEVKETTLTLIMYLVNRKKKLLCKFYLFLFLFATYRLWLGWHCGLLLLFVVMMGVEQRLPCLFTAEPIDEAVCQVQRYSLRQLSAYGRLLPVEIRAGQDSLFFIQYWFKHIWVIG